jgi:hypothetical protein
MDSCITSFHMFVYVNGVFLMVSQGCLHSRRSWTMHRGETQTLLLILKLSPLELLSLFCLR